MIRSCVAYCVQSLTFGCCQQKYHIQSFSLYRKLSYANFIIFYNYTLKLYAFTVPHQTFHYHLKTIYDFTLLFNLILFLFFVCIISSKFTYTSPCFCRWNKTNKMHWICYSFFFLSSWHNLISVLLFYIFQSKSRVTTFSGQMKYHAVDAMHISMIMNSDICIM